MQPRPGAAVLVGGHWIDTSFLDALYGGGRLTPGQRSAILDGADPSRYGLDEYDLCALTLGRLGSQQPVRRLMQSKAGGGISRAQPLAAAADADDCVVPLDGSEESLAAFAGLASVDARAGAWLGIYTDGPVPLFSGLVSRAEYFVFGAGLVGTWAQVPDGVWLRSLGPGLSKTSLLLRPGPVFQKGSMPYKLNASGHMVPDTIAPQTRTYTAGALIPNNTAVYLKQADGKIYPLDGTEAAANAYLGIVAVGVANGATATVYLPGTYFSTTGLTLVDGEVYAKEDGTLVAYASVASAKYTLCVLEADGTNSGSVVKGEIKLTS